MAPSTPLGHVDEERPAAKDEQVFEEQNSLLQVKTEAVGLQKGEVDLHVEKRTVLSKAKNAARRLVNMYINNYVLLILTAAVGNSLNSASLKVLSAKMSVLEITAIRSAFSALVLFLLCRWNGIPFSSYSSKLPLIVLRGVIGALAFLANAMATFLLPLSEFAFMANSYPVVTAVFSFLLGLERLGVLSWIGAFGCLIGNALVAHPPIFFGGHEDWGTQRIIGISFAASGNVLLSSMFIILTYLGQSVSTMVLSLSMHFCCFLISLPFVFYGYPMAMGLSRSWIDVFPLFIAPPSKVTTIYMSNMVISAVIGVLALSESMSWISITGAVVIFFSILLVQTQGPEKDGKTSYGAVPSTGEKETIELTVHQTS